MLLRSAKISDVEDIIDIHIASWRDAYRPFLDPQYLAGPIEEDRRSVWHERFAEKNVDWQVTVAEDANQILGFVCIFGNHDPKWGALLDNLHVSPHAKRRGIGRQLIESAAAWTAIEHPSQGMHLWVFEGNHSACAFYSRLGGSVVERTTDSTYGGSNPCLRYYWPKPHTIGSLCKR